ncbi:MAG: L-glyceraldehyde 3-phosphate reductase [Bacteroidia bacterium]|jgi:L-glyceraldehyde 3-phosphate reductase
MTYIASEGRYDTMNYRRCGKSGLKLPELSLGLWHNFGHVDNQDTAADMITYSFDHGITHFDLANNYGPPPGSAEENFGKILKKEMAQYRDEMIISSKAGYLMWPGPYGEWGSRKYVLASLEQSLKRMQLDYVDIFYSHRPDPETPLEETILALDIAVKQGKALYVGISNYTAEQTEKAIAIFNELKTPFIIHQPKYSMFERWSEDGLLDVLSDNGIGCIPFSPLAQGLLTEKYLKGIPEGSRASKDHGFLQKDQVTDERIGKVLKLQEIAQERGQSITQLAIAWLLRTDTVTSVLIGASSTKQIGENLGSLKNTSFSQEELSKIDAILGS